MTSTARKLSVATILSGTLVVPFFIAIYSLGLPLDPVMYPIVVAAAAVLFLVVFMSPEDSNRLRQSKPLSTSDQTKRWLVIILLPLLFLALPMAICGFLLFHVGLFSRWTDTVMLLTPFILLTPMTILFLKLDKVQKKGLAISRAVVRHSRLFGGSDAEIEPAETDPDRWRILLQELSDLALANDWVKARLNAEQIRKRWLGEPPAAEHQLVAAEQRLGVRLPPSYRAFLSVSNGWHFPHCDVAELAAAENIGWTQDVDRDLVRLCELGIQQAERHCQLIPITERDLARTLMINMLRKGDDGHFILNTAAMHGDEMDAWFFTTWDSDSVPHVSFWHLMVHVRDKMRTGA